MQVVTAFVPKPAFSRMVLTIWNMHWEAVSSVTRAPLPGAAPKITSMMSRIPLDLTS